MLIDKQPQNQIDEYKKLLISVGGLSKLFSENTSPYLYYRAAENIFCKAFNADNVSRSDASADAKMGNVGIGLKTFLNRKSDSSYQKVAEFNKNRNLYSDFLNKPVELVKVISELRNKRISSTMEIHNVSEMIYHSVIRDRDTFFISEEKMNFVETKNIENIKQKNNIIYFEDGKELYTFNISKSTLSKEFTKNSILEFEVKILQDPFELIDMFFQSKNLLTSEPKYKGIVCLPLYSLRGGKNVPEKSGLNQWNGGGRDRDNKEVYIPIPLWIHHVFKDFFPPIDHYFNLKLPNGKVLKSSVCQQGGKALMSNPNKDLGQWILDDILKKEPGKLVTLQDLEEINIDSVEVRKIDNDNFEIDFKEVGTYDEFMSEHLQPSSDEGAE